MAATVKVFKEFDVHGKMVVAVKAGGGREGAGAAHVLQGLKVEGLRGLCDCRV